jgi:CubicO group peptidase (beta-lactamase class C family)
VFYLLWENLNLYYIEFFDGFTKRHPVHAPSVSPTYSNVAFQILAYALESITGKTYEQMLDVDLIKKLSLNGTSYAAPINISLGIIPGSILTSGWNFDIGDEGPAGSLYSSSSDMVALGRSILSSSLISRKQTNRWLKPISFTSALQNAVGAPWEIFRIQLTEPPKIIDAYTKDGGLGAYTSMIVLIPDLDMGYVILAASPATDPPLGSPVLAELCAEFLVPAAEASAREEADERYAGTYASTDLMKLNSSIVITTDPTRPGLGVESWYSNDTDLFAIYGYVICWSEQSLEWFHIAGLWVAFDIGVLFADF